MCIVPQSHFDENFAGLLHLVWATTAGPNSSYSTKIFLGGVPWDISEQISVQVCSFVYMVSCWCFDIFIQGERDIIDLQSKYGQDKTSRDSFYYKILWQQENEGNEVEQICPVGILPLMQVRIIPWTPCAHCAPLSRAHTSAGQFGFPCSRIMTLHLAW